mmetsp:Transcript_43574/g.139890  ORF Transcript_43574/g.139890 Transcript_43574/m.139890 type:complete len:220 (-) Transcript_43574:427-1086(-)
MPRSRSYRFSLATPASMTVRTPGSVSDVSAMFVARMSRRVRGGGGRKTRAWSAEGSEACSGCTCSRGPSGSASRSCSASPRAACAAVEISSWPARKTRTSSPGPAGRWACTRSATSSAASSRAPSEVSGLATWCTVTGNVRDDTSTTGASRKKRLKRAASNVAEATTRRRGPRALPAASPAPSPAASPPCNPERICLATVRSTSVLIERSCASSRTTAP